jgi:hypothetical protein
MREMKNFWMLIAITGLLSLISSAQTTSGSASGNASVSPDQVNAGANASQNTQAAGASANTNASAQGQVNIEHKAKQESNSKAGAGSSSSAASSASAAGTGSSAVLASGTTLNAELNRSLDARSAKPGDQVTAKVTQDVKSNDRVVVHKGSKLVGHVTEARARSKENADSRLGIVFDKAILKGGQEMSLNGAVQALAPPVNAALSAAGDESSTISAPGPRAGGGAPRAGGGGLLGGATSTVGGATSTATGVVGGATSTVGSTTAAAVNGTTGVAGGLTAQGRLTNASQGAIGLQGLTLNSATAGSAQGSVVSSSTRNVKLDSGTQMLLKVTGSAQ